MAAESLWSEDRAAVVVTTGADGYWWIDRRTAPIARWGPAFAIEAVDTTGCGDVFHGAYAASLARGDSMENRLRIAAATSALKARHRGGQAGAPTLIDVDTFLRSVENPTFPET